MLALCAMPAAAGLQPEAIAIRVGQNAFMIPQRFEYVGFSLRFPLAWQTHWGDWNVATHFDATAGRLSGAGKHAGLYTVGPSATLRQRRLVLDVGTALSVLDRDRLNGRKFGGWFQFTSHIGVYYQPQQRWRIGYLLQHTSNAKIYSHNHGVDVHAVDIWFSF